MKILILAGSFDNNGGTRSNLAEKMIDELLGLNGTLGYRNGGKLDDLFHLTENCTSRYDAVIWYPLIPQNVPSVAYMKSRSPLTKFVSVWDDPEGEWTQKMVKEHAKAANADFVMLFSHKEGIQPIRIYGHDGTPEYEGDYLKRALQVIVKRLEQKMEEQEKEMQSEDTECPYCMKGESLFYCKDSPDVREVVIGQDGMLTISSNHYDPELRKKGEDAGLTMTEALNSAKYSYNIRINSCPICGRKLRHNGKDGKP